MKTFFPIMLYVIIAISFGCANIERSLVFSTGTTIGLEAAISPQSESPVDIIIGYKRAEILFDPIMNDAKTNSDKAKRKSYEIRETAHSIIAKLEGQIKSKGKSGTGPEADAGVTVSQWFASGKAAEILAKEGGAVALTDNPIIAEKVAKAASMTSSKGKIPDVVFSITNQLFQAIKMLHEEANTPADIKEATGQLIESLNRSTLVNIVPDNFVKYVPYNKSSWTTTEKYFTKKIEDLTVINGFQRTINYRSYLSDSVKLLSEIREAISDGNIKIFYCTSDSKEELKSDKKLELLDIYDKQKKDLDEWEKSMINDPEIIALWQFLGGK